jgi:hypothetical protein
MPPFIVSRSAGDMMGILKSAMDFILVLSLEASTAELSFSHCTKSSSREVILVQWQSG